MQQATKYLQKPVDYINAHGTSTPIGDVRELEAISEVFGDNVPTLSSTKSLTGHALGAAGVNEAIYSLLMLENDFICESAHIEELDPAAANIPIARKRQDNAGLVTVMSNSFGFGGTNSSLVFQRYDES
jgi:3-oxoacyl-[acyl-carrier-protein] synthase-1